MHTTIKKHLIDKLKELLPNFIAALNLWDEHQSSSVLQEYDEREIFSSIIVFFIRKLSLLYMTQNGILPSINPYNQDPNQNHNLSYKEVLSLLWDLQKKQVSIQRDIHHRHILDPYQYPLLLGQRPTESISFGYTPDSFFLTHIMLDTWRALTFDAENNLIDYRLFSSEDIGYVYEQLINHSVARSIGHEVLLLFKAYIPSDPPIPIAKDKINKLSIGKFKHLLHTQMGYPLSTLDTLSKESAQDIIEEHHIQDFLAPNAVLKRNQLYIVPGNHRRNLGAHYTPIEMVYPIVENTFSPLFAECESPPFPEKILHLRICDPAMGSGVFLIVSLRYLSEKLLHSWQHYSCTHQDSTLIPIDREKRMVFAKKLICGLCLYGIDKNPLSVEMCNLILWLETRCIDTSYSFMDYNCYHGDTLVGLTQQHIQNFHWEPPPTQQTHSKSSPHLLKMQGDAIIATFFATTKPLKREKTRLRYKKMMRKIALSTQANEIHDCISLLKKEPHPVIPIHWDTLFAEIFHRENPGFDALIGNPPFCGKNTIHKGNRKGYLEWLKTMHHDAHGNSDLVAHFFRKSYSLLRKKGCIGFIATNTIGQGDTRTTGLKWIVEHSGQIYRADRHVKWPSEASVIVSIVYIQKEGTQEVLLLDGVPVHTISSFLCYSGGENSPKTILQNKGICFQGFITLGMGFTFDEKSKKNVSSISEMEALIQKDPRNRDKIFPYIGGSELNEHPTHAHHRFVIDFFNLSESDARMWPDLMKILEEKVKPERAKQKRKSLREKWWQFAEKRPGMRRAIAGKQRILATNAQSSLYLLFSFLPTGSVYANSLNIFSFDSYHAFAILQSQIHSIFAWFHCSTLGEGIRYNPSDCFETFPFPQKWMQNTRLENIGRRLYLYRSQMMIRRNVGLTKIYGLYHNPQCQDQDITMLRTLHEEMDSIVLDSYDWSDIKPDYHFVMLYEIDESTWKPTNKKPYQYCWKKEISETILLRLHALNERQGM